MLRGTHVVPKKYTWEDATARELTQGFVFKHRQHWRAAVNWRDEDGRRRRLTKSTKIRCYPDKVDERTGEPPRFHNLHHTFATLAIASGADVRAVGAILGHANAAMTLNVYADALADSKRAGMERMDRLLSQ